jgi:hypothetical protein
MRVDGRHVGVCLAPEAIADSVLGQLCLGEAASLRAFLPLLDRFHLVLEGMITPGARLAPPPSLAMPVVLCHSSLGISRTGTPAGFHALAVLGDALGLFGLGSAVGHSRLLGQLAGVHDEKSEFFHRASPVSIFYFHRADDTVPVPTPWGFVPCPTRLCEQQRSLALLLPPHLPLLPHGTRARDQRDQP